MNRIKEALIEAGISQTELAKRLGKGLIWSIYTPRTKCNRLYPTIQDSGNTECGCAYTSCT